MLLIRLEVSISCLNLWFLQRYDGGLSWLLISLANPPLLCRTEHFELWRMKTWENNNAKILLSQNSTNWGLRAFLYQPGPPHAGGHSEKWPWETPSHSWRLLLPELHLFWFIAFSSGIPASHPVHLHSLFFPFLSAFHLLPSNSFFLFFSGSPLPPRHSLGTSTAPINRVQALLCLAELGWLFMLQTLSIFSDPLEVEG